MKDEYNMTPLNYNFFNNSYWYARYILLYEFQNYLQSPWPVVLQRVYLVRKKDVEKDHNGVFFFPFFKNWLYSTILFYRHKPIATTYPVAFCISFLITSDAGNSYEGSLINADLYCILTRVMWSALQPNQPSFDSWHWSMSPVQGAPLVTTATLLRTSFTYAPKQENTIISAHNIPHLATDLFLPCFPCSQKKILRLLLFLCL